jgi:outer membrane receptor protein involved in Fe transport
MAMAPPLDAQVLYGSIVGQVEDQSGAAVPSAKITASNRATGFVREFTADEEGRYSIPNLLPGTYEVKAEAQGFRPALRTDIEVTINTVARVDMKLEVGAVTEQVTVSATAVVLQTDKSDVRSEIGTKALTNLPLPGYRNYQSLLNLVPGTTPAEFQNAVVDTPARALTTNVNGANRNNNNTRVDGATNVFIWLPHHTVYVAPVESIETVNMTTSSFDAEQGMAGGAAITVATKSGTNDLHGVAFGYWDNQDLKARNFFSRTAKPESSDKIFGGTIGGPIKKDKLFYFGSFERFMERAGIEQTHSVPTADLRAGNFAASGTTIYDPSTGTADGRGRTAFPNNIIPANRISAIARRIQDSVPAANLTDRGYLNNFAVAGTEKLDRNNYDVKVNYVPVQPLVIWGKYSRMDAIVNSAFSLGAAGGPGISRSGVGTGDTNVNIATFGHTWTITPSLVLDGVFGYTRFDQTVAGPDHGTNTGSDVWGIPGTNNPIGPGSERLIEGCPGTACYSGLPIIDHDAFTDWGNTNGWMPLFRNDRSFTYSTNASKIAGAHEFRFGFDLVRHHMDHWQPEISNGPRGHLQFRGGPTALNGGTSPNNFNSYAAFLLGLPVQMQKAVQNFLMTNREWQFGLYARDRWQATRNLTLTLGLRYEYYPLITRKDRGIERWDPATNQVFLGGVGNNPNNVGITVSKRLFAPRLGFAYRWGANTVIRSGYGITYDPLPFARPLRGLYPSTIAATFPQDNTFAPVRSLELGIPPIPVPDISSGVITLPPTVDMGPRSPWAGELHRGYIQSWNVTVERRLPGDFVSSIAYVGNSTVHQLADRDINAAGPGMGNA